MRCAPRRLHPIDMIQTEGETHDSRSNLCSRRCRADQRCALRRDHGLTAQADPLIPKQNLS